MAQVFLSHRTHEGNTSQSHRCHCFNGKPSEKAETTPVFFKDDVIEVTLKLSNHTVLKSVKLRLRDECMHLTGCPPWFDVVHYGYSKDQQPLDNWPPEWDNMKGAIRTTRKEKHCLSWSMQLSLRRNPDFWRIHCRDRLAGELH